MPFVEPLVILVRICGSNARSTDDNVDGISKEEIRRQCCFLTATL